MLIGQLAQERLTREPVVNLGAFLRGAGTTVVPPDYQGYVMLPRRMPAHRAAQEGHVWWLERCGAKMGCREQLGTPDGQSGDTPLHYCARADQGAACRALLRLHVKPNVKNRWGLTPADLAGQLRHHDMAASLITATRHARARSKSRPLEAWEDPDIVDRPSSSKNPLFLL